MHLLQAQPGEASDGAEPVDLGQTPADLIVLSSADTELAALSAARRRLGGETPTLRLANLSYFGHPFTVDRYLDETATKARMVVTRILGGEAYWPYGLEQFATRLADAGVAFAALPGDDKPDDALRRASTVADADYETLWSYLVEGGPSNADNALRFCASMLDGGARPPQPSPLLRAGLYWPGGVADLSEIERHWRDGAPVAPIVFYRALAQSGDLAPIDALVDALSEQGLNPLPIFVASLKDPVSAATIAQLFDVAPPSIVLNATGFAVSSPQADDWRGERRPTPLDAPGRPVLQVVLSSGAEAGWEVGLHGLAARDIAMNVALPEVDGRLVSRAIAFKAEAYEDVDTQCRITSFRPRGDRVRFVAQLAANWARLAAIPPSERRIALVLANYPNKDGRLANGVGLDAPASVVETFRALEGAGYRIDRPPETVDALMATVVAGPTNDLTHRQSRTGGVSLAMVDYVDWFRALPAGVQDAVTSRWGEPEADPFVEGDAFRLAIHRYGDVVLGVQPARGYNIDPVESYHSPDLPPPHGYLAFYCWLRTAFGVDAIVHMGKHGNLEWLPGKAIALSEQCFPDAIFGPTPHFYPFIVNDPGEGTQAKRRTQATIIDHLTPPMTRAETYGALKDLEGLVDEYYEAAGLDPRRLAHLRDEILSLTSAERLDVDAGLAGDDDDDVRLAKLDAYLCELKERQIRDGLHVFGRSPAGRQETDLLVSLARVPRGERASVLRALSADLFEGSADGFDPLDCDMAAAWSGAHPEQLADVADDPWRSNGDTVERLELLAAALVSGEARPDPAWRETAAVLEEIEEELRPAVAASGAQEIDGLLAGLAGRFVPPGPSGAPTRGRPDVLPTGRNFFSVDSRAVPTPTAWTLGWKSATLLIERHLQEVGDWPRRMALTAWGTSAMRTGGDDIAQALALMGARPRWDDASRRVVGFEILPLSVLGRPRVDVTLRVSGFFRDAFPYQMDLVDGAARAIMALDEPETENPLAASFRADLSVLGESQAGARVFGAKPGAYGAGLQALIDERLWRERSDLAESFLDWGGYAYGSGAEGAAARGAFAQRLLQAEAVVQNQDNHEHDILDSDDYYQFEGGMAATVEALRGAAPRVYHNDHSRPERPVIRTLDEEIGRVVRARAANPKWIDGVKRHGYKGAFEIAATVDYLFAFAATTHAVRDHHFDLVYDAYVADDDTRRFIETANPAALHEIAERFQEAVERGLWRPRSNAAKEWLATKTGDRK